MATITTTFGKRMKLSPKFPIKHTVFTRLLGICHPLIYGIIT